MKRGNLKRRIGSLALAAAMAVTSFPAPGREVHAAEAPEPSKFATVEQLKAFNTDDTDNRRNTAKLYLGNNEQTWWIVGTQGGNSVTLVAANSLRDNNMTEGGNWVRLTQKFAESTDTLTYSADWECNYGENDDNNIMEVYSNHYGGSALRAKLKELETAYFSTAEQSLMKETTIYTNDTKNSTNDKKKQLCIFHNRYTVSGIWRI